MSRARGPARVVPAELTVNGTVHALEVPVHLTLLDLLRTRLGLTGTKESCRQGACGACTVLLDGRPIASCLVLAASLDGRSIVTIEGVTRGPKLHPLQEAFLECGGAQCGYCTPGMILSAGALLEANPHPTEAEIRRALSGNICRCTGYARIIEAVQVAARRMRQTPGVEVRP